MTNIITEAAKYLDPAFLAFMFGMVIYAAVFVVIGLIWGAWNHPVEHKVHTLRQLSIDDIGEIIAQEMVKK